MVSAALAFKPSLATQTSSSSSSNGVWLLAFNLFSTLVTINLNKWVFDTYAFAFPAALSNAHYLVTWLGVAAIRTCDISLVPPLPTSQPWRERNFLVMALLVGTVTPLNNLSLQLNSTAFYQVAKTAVTPFAVGIEYYLDRKLPSRKRALCLLAVCFAVLAMASSKANDNDTDDQRLKGFLAVSMWIPLAAGYKVQFGRLRTRTFGPNCSTLSIMYAILPIALAVQSCLIPVVDPPGLFEYEWSIPRAAAVLTSSVAAFLVNYSGFLVVGHLGALAHILLGQCKAAGTILLAAILHGERYSLYEVAAASAAMAAIALYSLAR